MRALGCLGVLLVLGLVAAEVWTFIQVAGWIDHHTRSSGYLESIGIIVVMMIVGVILAKRQIALLPAALMKAFTGQGGGEAGRRLIALLGAILLAVPGFLTDAIGLVLLFPPVQYVFASLGQRIAMVLAKQAMQKMMGGGMPGGGAFPGGFAGFPGGFPKAPFPGQPDDRFRAGGFSRRPGGKVYDTTAERADGDGPRLT